MKTGFKKICYWLLCKVLYRVTFVGKENIDFSKSNVLVANHVSAYDGLFIWSDIDNIAVMVKQEVFKFKPIGDLLKANGAFPIARGQKDFKQVFHAVNIVRGENPKNLLIFPEGVRGARQKGIKAKNGATYIAATTGVPMVPIYITENQKMFSKVTITYGKPIVLDMEKGQVRDKVLLSENTEKIMKEIYSLKGN